MENGTKDPSTLTTFQRRERMTQKKSQMGNGGYESLVSFRRVRRSETHRRTPRTRRDVKVLKEMSSSGDGGGDEDDKAEVERKIMALQRIVPGGESLGIDKLFEETAGYILELQGQVKAMRLLASFFEGLEKEKRKLGG